jgi:hypothetical protein
MVDSLALPMLVFGFALWLGFYLLARDVHKARLVYTGLGLTAYTILIALESMADLAGEPTGSFLARLELPFLFLPGLCWFGAAVDLLPDTMPIREKLTRMIRWLLPLAAVGLFILSLGVETPIRYGDGIFFALAGVNIFILLGAIYLVWQAHRTVRSRRTLVVLLVVTIFFGLGNALLLIPTMIFPVNLTLLAIDVDMILLGLLIAVLDAFDEGEALLPDMLYSFTISAVMAVLFGGQAILAMIFAGEITLPLLALLYGLVTAAIATQTFYGNIQSVIDRLVFARFARIRQARADLRAAANSLPRVNEGIDLTKLDDAEFTRLTRRALSHFGDLSRLSSSPLTRMGLIEQRLSARSAPDNTLERAAELKLLLTEGITRLKPRDKGEAGTSDEWRYYNALYYPYVLGVKPYSRNGLEDGLDAESKAVLDWFQISVPERTLHNWQNAAAKLIAQDLREQMG